MVIFHKIVSPKGSGLRAPARFFAATALALSFVAAPAVAQQAPPAQQQSSVPVPSQIELSKLVWTTMIAVDQANKSGNYSVLRDIAAPGFQANNNPARLAEIFAGVRSTGIDLSNTLLLGPTYTEAPAIIQPGVMRVQGYFGLRPVAIAFDLYYQWADGDWRIFGVSIRPLPLAQIQPEGT